MVKMIAPDNNILHHGDNRAILKTLPDNSIDAIITDPPYALKFMNRGWDKVLPPIETWIECLRVAKPGSFFLAFGGTRTFHRLTCAIEDAGFEIRDCIMWVYGSGFPKSHNIGKAIDKAAGAEGKIIGEKRLWGANASGGRGSQNSNQYQPSEKGAEKYIPLIAPATPEAQQWDGWGTALKPAWEPIIVARKPLIGTVAANVLEHGTGGINIDACRVPPGHNNGTGRNGEESSEKSYADSGSTNIAAKPGSRGGDPQGRFPANLIHDDSDEVVELFPQSKGQQGKIKGTEPSKPGKNTYGVYSSRALTPKRGDSGTAARFFYCAKASKKDRDEGNNWPTVKPTTLMRYLCRLVTPPNGVILDPFMGSGSTGKAALKEEFQFIGIEKELEGFNIAINRIRNMEAPQQNIFTASSHG